MTLNIESEINNQLVNKTEEVNDASVVNEIQEGNVFN